MNIKIHSVRFDADKRLIQFVNQKIEKLNHFSEGIVSAEVYLRLDNDQEKENKIAEIKIEYPGGPLFAKKQSKTFEEATDLAVDAIKKQIVKQKEKMKGI
ncbi:MAG TPA: ribosome-associated translation inhibitor RaiA [Bacteroidales bacterium]|nr:ribosome-associated translation inhibitor RaiA [Bacteroidales bacterium]HOK74223.1 ribosome-associated translation inhibitor RaiA [Bacteroidales bacterium]HOM39967.1 ribosome-associated translation inhibitor RaiA [Bacteroidales bacterium]HOU30654.1 ribosome-associated translation inhibitor RaiA [Bacteroidales bacterium]HPP92285.1 ribosome-associated translation inhibitor RaiA [Bacteroidales bacterium]